MDCAAGVTGFGGGGVGVQDNVGLALAFQLVAEAVPEEAEAGVQNVSAPQLSGTLRQVGVSQAHGVPGVGYPPGFLVDEVPPLIGDVLVKKPELFVSKAD